MTQETSQEPIRLMVCQGTGCVSVLSPAIRKNLEAEVKKYDLADKIKVDHTGCHGVCQQGPVVIIEPEGILYTHVRENDAKEIIEKLKENQYVERLYYKDLETEEPIPHYRDIPFYKHQMKVVLRNCGYINPDKIEAYLAVGGYTAAKKVLDSMAPEEVIQEIQQSGLRGRGGAGFPTGLKWKFCREAKGEPKYMICNADEGDPGAFMDRTTLEGDPHSVIEGLIIAAYAIGASKGYVYVRAEYPLAILRLRKALASAREHGYLGENILDSGFNFEVEMVEGAGAFVCGEETALMASIMGKRGVPRPRPPYPATSGVWGKPTTINNVKTLSSVPIIINNGAEWFSSIGTEKSKGTAVFALTGKINNSGLVEVPMGTTLSKIINDIGGGIPNNKKFKAVQTGGPSGGCIPAKLLDLPADYESLGNAGSIMGSGGMVVMDEDNCMVDVARYFLDFTRAESCGKCTPCRDGTRVMLEMLTNLTKGLGKDGDIETLEELANVIKDGSLCGLGQTAPNPVLTTIRYFREEYEAHIKEKKCPAKYCRDLISYVINTEACIGCGSCARHCPTSAISGEKKQPHVIDQSKCITCGVCYSVCPPRATAVERVDRIAA